MTNWTPPSETDLSQVAALATRPENRAYFFDRLENPRWVAALAKLGVFNSPPSPVPAEDLESLEPVANPVVMRTMLECVQALPSEQFQRLVPKIVEWITDPSANEFIGLFDDEASSVIASLVSSGNISQGFDVARAVLKLERRLGSSLTTFGLGVQGCPRKDLAGPGRHRRLGRPEVLLVATYHCNQILKA